MEQEDGGYDVQFVNALADDLTCIVCHLALRDPVQVADCGHRFCLTCFNRIERYAIRNSRTILCPLDRTEIEKKNVFKDQAAARAVLSLQVKCDHHATGCTWVGDLREVRSHEDVCTKKIDMVDQQLLNKMSKQMEDLMQRMGESEKYREIQKREIGLLRESLAEKDAKIKLLEENTDKQLRDKDKKINELKRTIQKDVSELMINKDKEISQLKNKLKKIEEANKESCSQDNIQQIVSSEMKSNEQKLSCMERRLISIEKLNPRMGAFEWHIENYHYKSENSECITSREFQDYLNGHVCQLSLRWFDRRKSRIGIYFHLVTGSNDHINVPFSMKVIIQCIGENGIKYSHEITNFCDCEEGAQVMDFYGDDYFLIKPELDKCIINDSMRFVCYLL